MNLDTEQPLTIGRLARQAGVGIDTVRFYERRGLLPHPARTPAGYRVYNDGSIQQLSFIRKAKSIGLTLKQIRKLLDLSTVGSTNCGEIASFARNILEEVREKIAHLQSIERSLDLLQSLCEGNPDSVRCPFVDNLLSDTNGGVN